MLDRKFKIRLYRVKEENRLNKVSLSPGFIHVSEYCLTGSRLYLRLIDHLGLGAQDALEGGDGCSSLGQALLHIGELQAGDETGGVRGDEHLGLHLPQAEVKQAGNYFF